MFDPKKLKCVQTESGVIIIFGLHTQHKDAMRMVNDEAIRAGFCRADLSGDPLIRCYGYSQSTKLQFETDLVITPDEYKFFKLRSFESNSGVIMVPKNLSHTEFTRPYFEWTEFTPEIVEDYYGDPKYDFFDFCNSPM